LTGSEGLVGEVGITVGPLAAKSQGRVRVHGEYWNATSDEPLEDRARVRVVSVDGLVVRVRADEE
jgi:membrane-bound serine protease (ClpP class)